MQLCSLPQQASEADNSLLLVAKLLLATLPAQAVANTISTSLGRLADRTSRFARRTDEPRSLLSFVSEREYRAI